MARAWGRYPEYSAFSGLSICRYNRNWDGSDCDAIGYTDDTTDAAIVSLASINAEIEWQEQNTIPHPDELQTFLSAANRLAELYLKRLWVSNTAEHRQRLFTSLNDVLSKLPAEGFEFENVLKLAIEALDVLYPTEEITDELISNVFRLMYHKYSLTNDAQDLREACEFVDNVDLSTDGTKLLSEEQRLDCTKIIFDRTQKDSDLCNAISKHQWTLKSWPDHHANLKQYLDQLGCLLIRKFEASVCLVDFVQAAKIALRIEKVTSKPLCDRGTGTESRIGRIIRELEALIYRDTSYTQESVINSWRVAMGSKLPLKIRDNDFMKAFEDFVSIQGNLEIVMEVKNEDDIQRFGHEAFDTAAQLPGVATLSHCFRLVDIGLSSPDSSHPQASDMREVERMYVTAEKDCTNRLDLISRLVNLSRQAQALSDEASKSSGLKRAKAIAEHAVFLVKQDRSTKSQGLTMQSNDTHAAAYCHLANILRNTYRQGQSVREANEACKYSKAAIAASSKEDPSILYTRALALGSRYYLTGDFSSLDLGIKALERSVELSSSTQKMSELGLLYRHHYLRTNVTASLSRAIDVLRDAIKAHPGPLLETIIRWNLGLCLWTRQKLEPGENTQLDSDLDETIKNYKQVLDVQPSGAPARAHMRINLVDVYTTKLEMHLDSFPHGEKPSPFTPAPPEVTQGMRLVEEIESNRVTATQWSKTSSFLLTKWHFTSARVDLEKAVSFAEEGMARLSSNHPERHIVLLALINALTEKSGVDGEVSTKLLGMLEDAINEDTMSDKEKPRLRSQLDKMLEQIGDAEWSEDSSDAGFSWETT